MTYKIIIDYGKPYTETGNKKRIIQILNNLKRIKDNYAYCDFWVYENNKDITESFLKEIKTDLKNKK